MADATREVSAAPPHLLDLIETLKHEGFEISIPQCVQAQQVLTTLASEGRLSDNPDVAARRVGPIFCRNPAQQLAFPEIFRSWWQPYWWVADANAQLQRSASMSAPPQQRSGSRFRPTVLIWAISLLTLAYAVYKIGTGKKTTSGSVLIPPVDTVPSRPEVILTGWGVTYVLLILTLVFTGSLLWKRYRSIYAVRREWANRPKVGALNVRTRVESSFPAGRYRSAFVALAQRVREPSGDIDAAASAVATAAAAGEFTPVYAERREARRFLALVHQVHVRDHQARVFHTVLDELERYGAQVERFVFETTPGRCRRGVLNAPRESLSELQEWYGDRALLICGDTDLFFNAFSGALLRWIEEAGCWQRRTILLPQRAHDGRETLLADQGWEVVEFAPEPLHRFAAHLNGEPARQRRANSRARYSRVMHDWRDVCVGKVTPGRNIEDCLIADLRAFLGSRTFALLCACAAYPEIHWDITRYLARALLPVPAETESLIRLSSLPWFRIGWMPTWFRLTLEAELPKDQRKEIQTLLRGLIVTHVRNPGGDLQLLIVPPDVPSTGRITWLDDITERIVSRVFGGSVSQRPTEDYVTLMFLFGHSSPHLAVSIPDDVRHAIRTRTRRKHRQRHLPWPKVLIFLFNLVLIGGLIGLGVAASLGSGTGPVIGVIAALIISYFGMVYMAGDDS